FYSLGNPPHPHSFPTRRSSDLANAKRRSTGYDCVIPVSGGKDSTWQVVTCLEHGLKPLAVTWKTPARTDIGSANLANLVRLGVEDRKSTRLNSSHVAISYAVFC